MKHKHGARVLGAAGVAVILGGLIASGTAFAADTMSTGNRGVEGSGRLTTAALLRGCRSAFTPVGLGDPGAYRIVGSQYRPLFLPPRQGNVASSSSPGTSLRRTLQ